MMRGRARRTRIVAQSAMEYLMTYGWAILIIAVVLGVLFQMGVFNSSSFSVRAPPGACKLFRPAGPGSNSNLNLLGVCNGQMPKYVTNFNGQSSYLKIGNYLNSQSMTISFWMSMPVTNPSWNSVVDKGQNPVPHDWYFFTPFTNCGNGQGILFNAGPGEICYNWGNGDWHFVVGVYNSSITTEYLFVDGVQRGSQVAARYTAQSYNVVVGAMNNCLTCQLYSGLLSNIQMYNASFTLTDVKFLYQKGIGAVPMMPQNLVGWWPLNGDYIDYSGNNYNGQPGTMSYVNQWTNGYAIH
jgi:hypothetical protein